MTRFREQILYENKMWECVFSKMKDLGLRIVYTDFELCDDRVSVVSNKWCESDWVRLKREKEVYYAKLREELA